MPRNTFFRRLENQFVTNYGNKSFPDYIDDLLTRWMYMNDRYMIATRSGWKKLLITVYNLFIFKYRRQKVLGHGTDAYTPMHFYKKGGNIYPLDLLIIFILIEIFIRVKKETIMSSRFFFKLTELYLRELEAFVQNKNFDKIVVLHDTTFHDKILLDIGKKLGIQTFIELHGLPIYYGRGVSTRADNLIVWSTKIGEHFRQFAGYSGKIIVRGLTNEITDIKFPDNIKRILICSKNLTGVQYPDNLVIQDASIILVWLEDVLMSLASVYGSSIEVKLRLHPAEKATLYTAFKKDLILSKVSLESDLQWADILIGPPSTMLINSSMSGKRYIVYEPIINNFYSDGYRVFPPFDRKGFVATNKNELIAQLRDVSNGLSTQHKIFKEYAG